MHLRDFIITHHILIYNSQIIEEERKFSKKNFFKYFESTLINYYYYFVFYSKRLKFSSSSFFKRVRVPLLLVLQFEHCSELYHKIIYTYMYITHNIILYFASGLYCQGKDGL